MTDSGRGRLLTAALALVGLLALVASVGGTLAAGVTAGTIGYDFLAYRDAALRVLAGAPLYDPSAIGDGSYLYPPPSVLAFLPFALLPTDLATGAFVALSIVALVGAVAILPVSGRVRAAVLLLGALDYATAHAIVLGQVAPFLLFACALAARDAARTRAGIALGLATVLRLTPGLALAACLAPRSTRRAASIGVGMALALLAGGILILGFDAYADYARVLLAEGDPGGSRHSVALAPSLALVGVDATVALTISLAVAGTSLALLALLARSDPSRLLMAAIAASLLVSPVLRDHHTLILLVPVAWLLARGIIMAALAPLATSIPLVVLGVAPPLAFPLAALLVLVLVTFAPQIAVDTARRVAAE